MTVDDSLSLSLSLSLGLRLYEDGRDIRNVEIFGCSFLGDFASISICAPNFDFEFSSDEYLILCNFFVDFEVKRVLFCPSSNPINPVLEARLAAGVANASSDSTENFKVLMARQIPYLHDSFC